MDTENTAPRERTEQRPERTERPERPERSERGNMRPRKRRKVCAFVSIRLSISIIKTLRSFADTFPSVERSCPAV